MQRFFMQFFVRFLVENHDEYVSKKPKLGCKIFEILVLIINNP